jgi:predicted CopG family antitoxin
METTLLDCLYEELVMLDEQAGCFDEVTNRFIDDQRRKLFEQITELEQLDQN